MTLLAILKTGAAYVPIDPAYPADRVSYILGDAKAPVLITSTALPMFNDVFVKNNRYVGATHEDEVDGKILCVADCEFVCVVVVMWSRVQNGTLTSTAWSQKTSSTQHDN